MATRYVVLSVPCPLRTILHQVLVLAGAMKVTRSYGRSMPNYCAHLLSRTNRLYINAVAMPEERAVDEG